MSQFVRFLRGYQFLQSLLRGYPGGDMWRFCHHPFSSHRSTSFCYRILCDLRFEILVGMCCFSVWVYWFFWRYVWFVKLVEISFELGWGSFIVLIWELHLVCLPVFGSVDRFKDVSVRTADIGHWELFIFIEVYQLCLEESSYSEIRQRWSWVFTLSFLWWIDCHDTCSVNFPQIKSSYSWSSGEFYCLHATCWVVIG